MKTERLVRYLNSVGKECFVKYFELFSNDTVPNHEIAERIFAENDYTEKSCNSRTGHARMIIREDGTEEALRIISESKRLDSTVTNMAEKYLKSMT
jgi:hypothetical protein